MNKEELLKSNMKEVILDNWKSKLGYLFNYKDLEELENIINYYEQENKELHNKIDKCLEYLEDKNNVEWIKIDKLLQVLKDSDVDEC